MRSTPQVLERRRIKELAREYAAKGYEVYVEPSDSVLPDFLRGLGPDLVAHSTDESVVVQIRSQHSLVGDERLGRLADLVNGRPRWRLELVVTNPQKSVLADDYQVIDGSEIRARLNEARALAEHGSRVAAMLLLWSAAEATLRHIAQADSIKLFDDSPGHLLKQLALAGAISQTEYEVLRGAVDARNALVHGFSAPRLSQQLLDQLADVVHGLAVENGKVRKA